MPKGDIKKTYLQVAQQFSKLSYATRMRVGSLLVTKNNDQILSFGYNGTPPGMDNCCEDERNVTLPTVIHAEAAAILKCAKAGKATDESIMYLTLSPCLDCSKLILTSGIRAVYYIDEYRDTTGITFLTDQGIICEQMEL